MTKGDKMKLKEIFFVIGQMFSNMAKDVIHYADDSGSFGTTKLTILMSKSGVGEQLWLKPQHMCHVSHCKWVGGSE